MLDQRCYLPLNYPELRPFWNRAPFPRCHVILSHLKKGTLIEPLILGKIMDAERFKETFEEILELVGSDLSSLQKQTLKQHIEAHDLETALRVLDNFLRESNVELTLQLILLIDNAVLFAGLRGTKTLEEVMRLCQL